MPRAVFLGLNQHTDVVWHWVMTYADALAAYLSHDGAKQEELAAKVGCRQATISRYKTGERLPDRSLAEKIDEHTEGQVPLSLWIVAASKKFGLAA